MELTVGAIVEGKVKSITNFGAFVSLPEGKTGMVHISEVANAYVSDIRQHLTEGQDVKVMVIGMENGKINLSIKRTLPQQPRAPRPQQGGRAGGQGRPGGSRPQRADGGRVWQPKRSQPQGDMSFEDMMARFKSQSEEKISDLKRVTENRRGGGYSRKR